MSAHPAPTPNPSRDPVEVLLGENRERYMNLIDNLREGEAWTATPGWKGNWRMQADKHDKETKRHTASLRTLSEEIEKQGSSEETEKALKDAVKGIMEARETRTAFITCAVGEYINAIDQCERIRQEVRGTLRQAEGKLQYGMLSDPTSVIARAESNVKCWPIPTWDSLTGRICVDG